jgi:hypothetical protein
MAFPTKGTLSEIDFIDLLENAASSELSGMLRLEAGSIIKVVYLQQGTIAFASSNEKSDRLTEVLRRAGKLTAEQIEHAQSRLRPPVSLGKTLVELGYISPKELLWGARMQVEGIVHQLLFWDRGNFQFNEGPLPKEIVSLNLSIPGSVYEGILKTRDRQWVLQHIGSPEAIYSLTSDFHEKNARYKLPVEELVTRMDGKRTLEDIAQSAGKDTFEVCKSVVALEKLKLVRPLRDKPLQMPLLVVEEQDQTQLSDELPESLARAVEAAVDSAVMEKSSDAAGIEEEPEAVKPMTEETAETTGTNDIPIEEEKTVASPPEKAMEVLPEEAIEAGSTPKVETAIPAAPDIPDVPVPFETLTSGTRRKYKRRRPPVNWSRVALVMVVLGSIGIAAAIFYSRSLKKDATESEIPTKSSTPSEVQTTTGPSNAETNPPSAPESSLSEPDLATAEKGQNVETREKNPSISPPPVEPPIEGNDPIALAKAGKLQEAALLWKRALDRQKRKLTIQLEIACQEKTVMDAFAALQNASDLLVIPMNYKGQPCYRVLFGTFSTAEEAENAKQRLPAEFLKQQSPPQIVPVSRILQ